MTQPTTVSAGAFSPEPAAAAAPLTAEGLIAGYRTRRGRTAVVDGVHVALRPHALTCLLGPNGSGKSTLLRTLAGMQPPLAGACRLDGADVTAMDARERARRLAVVLTDPVDAGLLRAVDLVALGRHPHTRWDGRLRAADREAVSWALRATGAERLADRRVAELSDGERQRVLIARALAQEPTVLCLDEPVAFVDLPRRVELMGLLAHLTRECAVTVLLTTHDLDLALRAADEVWLLEPGAGAAISTVRVGAPEDLALAGAVERAFAGTSTRFDLDRGAFVALGEPLATACVRGPAPVATWAARALERAGLTVVAGDDNATATVQVEPGEPVRWRLRGRGWTEYGTGLGSLAEAARALLPALAADPPR